MDSPEPPITVLRVEDAGELLILQRAAYVTEAQAHDDPRLPPLLETPAEVRAATCGRMQRRCSAYVTAPASSRR